MPPASPNVLVGFLIALASAAAFGSSGALAKGLITAGWTPAAAVVWRVAVGALVMMIPAALALRGRWRTMRTGWGSVLVFGVVAVAGCQLAFFEAVERLQVAVALLLEFSTGVLLVVLWHWLKRGKRPRRLTLLGAVIALFGLGLIVDVFGSVSVDPVGVAWGLVAGFGMATYFVVSEDESHGIPTIAVAAGGLLIGAIVLLLAGAVGIVELVSPATTITLAGWTVNWWWGVLAIGVFAAAFAYGAGIAAVRRLGSKLASFVGLSEVIFAVVWAWALLAEVPAPVQLVGGVLIIIGVLVVRLDSQAETVAEGSAAVSAANG